MERAELLILHVIVLTGPFPVEFHLPISLRKPLPPHLSFAHPPPPAPFFRPASCRRAVPLPPSSYPLWDSLPADLVDSGKLSTLQLEGILYACTKHCELLPSGERTTGPRCPTDLGRGGEGAERSKQ